MIFDPKHNILQDFTKIKHNQFDIQVRFESRRNFYSVLHLSLHYE